MKPILQARLAASDARGLLLDCGDGAAMRIVALQDDLVRVTLLRDGTVRQKRTWATPCTARLIRSGPAATGWTTARGRPSRPRSWLRRQRSRSRPARSRSPSRSRPSAWTGRCPMEQASHATARRSPISSVRKRTPSGTRWPARPATAATASATRPARSTSPGGGCDARCETRSASTPSAAIPFTRTGRS